MRPASAPHKILGGAASATTAVLDFNNTKNSANTTLLASGPNGKVTDVSIGGRKAVQTGGTADNEFLYVGLPKGAFASSKAVWAVIDYYDAGTDTFATHFTDTSGNDTMAEANLLATTKHDTKTWTTYSIQLTGFGFTEAGPGGGSVVAAGTPERVAACAESHTGRYLREMLERGRRA